MSLLRIFSWFRVAVLFESLILAYCSILYHEQLGTINSIIVFVVGVVLSTLILKIHCLWNSKGDDLGIITKVLHFGATICTMPLIEKLGWYNVSLWSVLTCYAIYMIPIGIILYQDYRLSFEPNRPPTEELPSSPL